MLHLALRARVMGNPLLYQTFLDESLNSALKRCLRQCHQRRFEAMGLCKINALLASRRVRARTR
eukprot:1850911-Alexandrium_andersonii.AAC.1